MASTLLTLLDDITYLLDDISLLTKVAAKKTAGVLGDDLALNAQQVAGVRTERELPVVWAVALGSLVNKAILVPAALALSAFFPVAVVPLLMIGGAYLCYEGFEKIVHRFLHPPQEDEEHRDQQLKALVDPEKDIVALEKEKIAGAIRTDFILSAEIIVITLGTVAKETLMTQVGVMIGIAMLMTVGVYGLVAAIVKLDDAGVLLTRSRRAIWRGLGHGILAFAPWLMRFLSVAGTVAMFLVGGHILTEGIPWLHDMQHHLVEGLPHTWWGEILHVVVPSLLDALAGLLVGAAVLVVFSLGAWIWRRLVRRAR